MKFMKVAGSEILYGGHIPTETFFFFFFFFFFQEFFFGISALKD